MEAGAQRDGGGIEGAIGRACARTVAWVERRPGIVLAVAGAATLALAVYAALSLGVNADPRALINQDLPFQVRQREFVRTFHSFGDQVIGVVDADSPIAAQRAADRLAERLRARPDLFSQVYVPGGGPFFARNALLYLEPAQLEELTDRLGKVQPFLAELARDQSLVGVADLLREALAAQARGQPLGLDLGEALDRISAAVEATTAGRPAVDPWGTALLGGALPAEARQRIVALRPTLDYGTLLNAAPAVAAVRDAAQALALDPAHGVRVRLTGDPVVNYEEWIALGRQSLTVAVVSIVLFTLAVTWALRSWRMVAALVGSLLTSLVWSNAFAAAAVGHLNQISAAFNVILVGLGGELGIHFVLRYGEVLGQGRSRRDALVETARSIGTSLVSSAGTTSIGLYIFLFTDFTGVGQLGLISGTGVLISLVSTLIVLPALLALGTEPPRATRPVPPRWVAALEHLPLRWARPIRWTAAAVALAAVAILPRVRFDYNLLALRDPTTESVSTFDELLSRQATSPWTIDVVAPDLAAAGRLSATLEALPTVAETRTLADWVPSDQEEKRETLATAAYFVPAAFATGPPPSPAAQHDALVRLEAAAGRAAGGGDALAPHARRLRDALTAFLAGPGADTTRPAAFDRLAANVVGSLPEQVRELTPLLEPEVVEIDDLPGALREQMLVPDGRARIEVLAREDLSDSVALERFVDDVRAVVPDATGPAVWLVEWGRVTWRAMLSALVGGVVIMLCFLVVLWRSLWDPLLAFFPLALAALLTCASLVLLDRPFNFANVIVLPMLIGMGVDNGVHLVHRHRTNPEEEDVLATSTARAVFYAAVTTILSFGSLSFASHGGMAAIGTLLTVGVAWTLVSYVVVLPAVLAWDDVRRRGAGRAPAPLTPPAP